MAKPKDQAIHRMNQALRHIEVLHHLLSLSESSAERDFITGRLRSLMPENASAKVGGSGARVLSAD